jgi:hypothetical protein
MRGQGDWIFAKTGFDYEDRVIGLKTGSLLTRPSPINQTFAKLVRFYDFYQLFKGLVTHSK